MRTWSLGAGASETIFAGGARSAAVREAEADYDNAVATYRQTVLTALQDTEDQLSNLHYLNDQMVYQEMALKSANEAVRVSMNEYLAGTQIYTTVITAQQTALQYEETRLQIQQQRILSEVRLITDLGEAGMPRICLTKTHCNWIIHCYPALCRKIKTETRLKFVRKAGFSFIHKKSCQLFLHFFLRQQR